MDERPHRTRLVDLQATAASVRHQERSRTSGDARPAARHLQPAPTASIAQRAYADRSLEHPRQAQGETEATATTITVVRKKTRRKRPDIHCPRTRSPEWWKITRNGEYFASKSPARNTSKPENSPNPSSEHRIRRVAESKMRVQRTRTAQRGRHTSTSNTRRFLAKISPESTLKASLRRRYDQNRSFESRIPIVAKLRIGLRGQRTPHRHTALITHI